MNKHLYRIVFNRALGVLQVVAEIARRAIGSGPAAGVSRPFEATVPALRFGLWCALGFVTTVPAMAQVVADPTAPGNQRPTVLEAPNGTPLINIQTPSAAGVSRNTYRQFDVNAQGAILNNSRTNAQTQLGGWVQGNPWLATGTAKVILNEVNSANPSHLRGYVEVAGDRAQVVIANPAGIQVDGGGFLNASQVTLTTGKPVFNGASLDSYRVEGGAIRVEGAGLDSSRADYTALLARALEVNAGIWAQQLQVTAGANTVSADATQVAMIAGNSAAPAFALDVSTLGGMYAGKISLLGTEHGVGVRNAGTIGAQAGELVVTVDGRLENTGALQAQTDTRVSASGGVANAGTLSATRELMVSTPADVDNSGGTLNARRVEVNASSLRNRGGAIEQTGLQAMALRSGALSNRDGGRIGIADAGTGSGTGGGSGGGGTNPAPGTPSGGTTDPGTGGTGGGTTAPPAPVAPLADGLLAIAGTLDNDGGVINAGGGVDLDIANGLDNSGGHLGLRQLTLTQGDLGNTGGELSIAGDARLTVNRIANDGGRLEIGGALQVDVQDLSNRGGTLTQGGTAAATVKVAGTLDNTDGTFASNASSMALDGGVLVNERGRIEHAGSDGLGIRAGTLAGRDGAITTAGKVTLTAGQADHRGATLSATQVALDAAGFDNRGGTIVASSAGANTLTVRGTLDNGEEGTIASNGDLQITADTFGNASGTVKQAGTGVLAINATTLNGTGGTLASNGALTLTGQTTDLRGGTTFAQSITVDTGTLITAGGTLTSAGTNTLAITAHDRLDNTAGTIAANGTLQLQAGALVNIDGTITATGSDATDLRVTNTLDNTRGTLAAAGPTSVHAGAIDNTDGIVQAASEAGLTLTADGRLINDGGTIESNGAIALNAQSLTNAAGTVQTQRTITAKVADALDNTGGTMVAGGDLAIEAGALVNRDTFDPAVTDPAAQKGLFGERVTLSADTIDNARGQIHAADALTLRGRTQAATALTNAAGTIDGAGAVAITATTFDNADGTLIQRGAAGALTLTAGGMLTNTAAGLVGAEGTAILHVGTLDNTAGTVFATHGLVATADGDIVNRDGGLLQSNAGLTLTAGGALDNRGGAIDATGAAQVTAANVSNADGQILAGTADDANAALTVTASGALDNQGGTIGSRGGDLVLHATSIDNRAAGTLVAQRDLTLDTAVMNNAGGTVYTTRYLRYENAVGRLDNAGGQFGAGEAAWLNLANVSNTNGGRIQAGTVWLATPALDLTGGEVAANALHASLTTLTGLGVINASNADGTGLGRITVSGTLDNRAGASIEGDNLVLTARDVINTSREGIVGDAVRIEADTLTNGRDLGNQEAAVDYGEGFIGAAETLELRIAQRLSNLDADIFSAGDLTIAGRADGTRVGTVANISGRIQAEGDAYIAAEHLHNERRMVGVETYNLTPQEQYALSSQRQFDEAFAALSEAERQRLNYLNGRGAALLSAAEITEKKALNHKVGWQTVDHVSDEMLAAINTWYRTIGAPGFGASDGYVIDNAGTAADNPGAQVIQRDTYTQGERLVDGATSAAGQIVTGGDLTIDAGQRVRNYASQIAAGRYLTIAGQHYTGTTEASDALIENIAVVAQLDGERETQAWVYPEIPAMYRNGSGWHQTVAELQGFMHEAITTSGPTLVAGSITAGQGLSIEAGDVTNTSVGAGGGLSDLNGGALNGPGSTGLGPAAGVQGPAGPGGPNAAAPQVVGTPDRPLPGLVPADNGMFDLHADPLSPFLVTTAPRFARGDGTGSNHLLGMLGASSDLHKRLGDGYYEQRLVLEQLLQLTGRRSLTGDGDGFAQYRGLMDNAATEAARMGLALGAPLTSAQITALNQDIVWLVEQEVNGQKVLVPVVYLSKATADRMKAEGALIAADTVDIQSTGTVRNDGTLSSERGSWLSADTLINDGAIRSGGRVDIATRGDTINRGKLVGNTVAIDAGGDVINTVRFDGLNARGGAIEAGAGGLQVSAARDVINQGTINSAGHAVVSAGRDFVQNAATTNMAVGGIKAPAGSLTAGGSAVVSAGRDAVLDQSAVTAGQHAVIDAGRDAKFIASDVTAGGSIAVTAGRDIVSETVSDSITIIQQTSTKQGKKRTNTTTTTIDETVTGSTFQAGGDIAMVADRDITLTAATVHSDKGGIALAAKRDVNLLAAQETDSTVQDSVSKKKGTFSSTRTTTHSEVSDTTAHGTTLSGETVSVAAARDITTQAANVVATGDVALAAGRHLTIGTAETGHSESFSQTKKKSGVL